jgi:hypothetical protein
MTMPAAMAQWTEQPDGTWAPPAADTSQDPVPDGGGWVASSVGASADVADWSSAVNALAGPQALSQLAQAGMALLEAEGYGADFAAG